MDGGYLGVVRNFKTFDLRPGSHSIEVRNPQGTVLMSEKGAIVPGGTTRIEAKSVSG